MTNIIPISILNFTNGFVPAWHRLMLLSFKLIFTLLIGLALSDPAAARLYKWVDDQGITHYGETIPPEYAGNKRVELMKSGRVIRPESGLTAEEVQAQQQEEEQNRIEQKAALEQKRHDRMLTSIYSNESEIELARNRSLQHLDARINSIDSQRKTADSNVTVLRDEAAGYSKANKPIPESLQEDLGGTQEYLNMLQQTFDKLKADREAMDKRYDNDKMRYRQLTGK